MNFFAAGLLPILFVVPLFDILTYFGILPFIIRWVGKLLTFLTRAPKFESFFAIEMMFLSSAITNDRRPMNTIHLLDKDNILW